MPKLCRIDPEARERIYAELLDFVRELKARFPITHVYLFGSFARGDIHEGSDIDLIIVGEFEGRLFDRIARILELTDLPIEPLVYTPEEFAEMVKKENPFIIRVLKEGKDLLSSEGSQVAE